MGVERSMKIFFEGMQGQFIDGGYGPRIVSTPMGPFRWNDHRELWENVNNGMVLNNISFQDMMIMGYETSSGDNGTIGNICGNAGFVTSQNLQIGYTNQNSWQYVPFTRSTTTNTCSFTAYIDIEDISGSLSLSDFTFKYKNTSSDDTSIIPDAPPYQNLLIGSSGTNISILPGTTFGFGNAGANQSKVAFAILFNGYNEDPLQTLIGNISFKVKIYNKDTNTVIHTAGFTFNNLDTSAVLTPSSFGVLTGVTTADQIFWAGTTGPRLNLLQGTPVVVSSVYPSILVGLTAARTSGTIGSPNLQTLYYSIDDGAANTYTAPFTVVNDNTIRIGAKFPPQEMLVIQGAGLIRVTNQTAGATLTGITWSYTLDSLPE